MLLEKIIRAGTKPRLGLTTAYERNGRASGSRRKLARRRRKRFDGAKQIRQFLEEDGSVQRRRLKNSDWNGEHEDHRGNERALGIVAAGHRAGGHAKHFMTTVHMIFRRGGSLVMVMPFNRALTGSAASSLI